MADFSIDASCKQAELYYYDVLFEKGNKAIPPSILTHINDCDNCREQLKRLEDAISRAYSSESEQESSDSVIAAILKLHLAHRGKPVTCETIRPFLPTFLHPGLRVTIPTPITVHLDHCQACSADLQTIKGMNLSLKQLVRLSLFFADDSIEDGLFGMQEFDDAVHRIAQRADSGVITRYETISEAAKADSGDIDMLYADWPISVQVSETARPSDTDSVEPVRLKSRARVLPSGARQFLKPSVAAAAILVVVLFLLNGPAAKAVVFGQVYDAIRNAKNVCISSFAFGEDEARQRIWVSRTADIKLQTAQKQAVLFDLRDGSRKVKDLTTGSVETSTTTEDLRAKVSSYLAGTLALTPFSPEELKMKVNVEGAEWRRVDNENTEAALSGTEVYDLTWIQKPGWCHRWRYFIDPVTIQPIRVEAYSKTSALSDYELKTVQLVTYPTDGEFESVIQSFFGRP